MIRHTIGKIFAGLFLIPCFAQAAEQAPAGGYPDVDVPMSELDEGFLRVGRYVQAATISQVNNGASAEQVTRLLGTPESVDRYPGRQEWYYSINLPLADGVNQLVCQYRVDINDSLNVLGTQWRRNQCRTLFGDFVGSLQVMSFSSDVLFRFDSAELEPEGRRELSDVALILMNQYDRPIIQITGHADRLGRESYNQRLSERRAVAVQTFLESQGLSSSLMRAEGRGTQDPITICLGTQATQQLKDCLAPNRRVNLQIVESTL